MIRTNQTHSVMKFLDKLRQDAAISKASLEAYQKIEGTPTDADIEKAKFLSIRMLYGGEFDGIVTMIEEDFLVLQEGVGGGTPHTLRIDMIANYKMY